MTFLILTSQKCALEAHELLIKDDFLSFKIQKEWKNKKSILLIFVSFPFISY